MDAPQPGAFSEDIAYRAGVTDTRLRALEAHNVATNGTIKATGDALTALTIAVNDLALTVKLLDLTTLSHRVADLETRLSVSRGVTLSKRYLLTAVVSCTTAGAAVMTVVIYLVHL